MLLDFGDVVGNKRFTANQGGINDEASIAIQAHPDAIERLIPLTRLLAIQTAKGDMRERLCHAVCAPYRTRQTTQLFSKGIVDRTATDDKVLDAAQSLPLLWHLQGIIDLHRHHRHEVEIHLDHFRQRFIRQGVTRRLHREETKLSLDAPHHHHLACDIVERHAEQS